MFETHGYETPARPRISVTEVIGVIFHWSIKLDAQPFQRAINRIDLVDINNMRR